MHQLILRTALLCLCCYASGMPAAFGKPTAAAQKNQVQPFTIPNALQVISDLNCPRVGTTIGCKIPVGGFTLLRRVADGGAVAIILWQPKQTAILNPSGDGKTVIDYGPIPNLTALTPEISDRIFGQRCMVASKSDYATYELNRQWIGTYYLDLSFKGGKLCRYRVRGGDLDSDSWTDVKNQEP